MQRSKLLNAPRRLIFISILVLILNTCYLILNTKIYAQAVPPASGNYKLMDYGFGAGGTATSSSSNYSLFGTLVQVDQGSPSSANYFIGAGLEYTMQATVAAAPTFTNPSNWYNKLKLVINRGGTDPSDYQYAVRIASGSGTFQYAQNDMTVGNDLNDEDWQSYTAWGAQSGSNIIGLYPSTTYTVQVAARQGRFYTQFIWSPTAIASTDTSSISFDIDIAPDNSESAAPYTLGLGELAVGSVTTSTDKVWVDFSTNANNGGFVSISGTNNGLQSTSASHTITSATADLTAQPQGYGAISSTATQTSGGPIQALSPYNGSSDNVGVLDTEKRYIYETSASPIVGGRVSFSLKAKASNTTPSANDYADILTILVTGSF
ncbi:MAG: hypothetical protein Q7T54_01925 [Candidatus Levybacteria bacterium]|nr:hypothetical protein [Candidatus Levybacteria bacterium]